MAGRAGVVCRRASNLFPIQPSNAIFAMFNAPRSLHRSYNRIFGAWSGSILFFAQQYLGIRILLFDFGVELPEERSLAEEGRETLQTQIELAPQMFEARASTEYGDPAYAQLNMDVLRQTLPQAIDLYGQAIEGISPIQQAAARSQREADIRDVRELGPQFQEAVRAANPEQYALMNRLTTQAENAGPTELETMLVDRAKMELGKGDSLSDDEVRKVRQDTRAAYNDRGMFRSNRAIGEETLNLDASRRNRLAQRFAMASNAAGIERSGQSADRSFQQGVAGMWGASTTDPLLAVTGRPSQATNPAMAQQSLAQRQTQQTANYFNPFSPYAMDLYNTNYNAALNANIASSNNTASLIGAGIGAGGMLGGAAILCWVAQEAIPDRWTEFRKWLIERAPLNIFSAYARHGRQLAAELAASPQRRTVVASAMETILNPQMT